MVARQNRRKGQVFTADVLFALLPIMIMVGASLQYLYLGEEDMKAMAMKSRLENAAQDLSAYTTAKMFADPRPYINETGCTELSSLLSSWDSTHSGFKYFVYVDSFYDNKRICIDKPDPEPDNLWSNSPLGGANALLFVRDPSASELRFMLEYDDKGVLRPGRIAGVSFTTWEE